MIKWSDRGQKWITPRNTELFLKIVYIVSLIPIFIIGWYNFPSADDYTNGSVCHHAALNGSSFLEVIGVSIERMVNEWFQWRGGFTSSFLSNLVPCIYSERQYILTIWIIIGMLSVSTWYFLNTVFIKVFKANKHSSHCVSLLVLFITVHCMVGRNEAFYWYSGAINYTFLHGMSLLFYGLLIAGAYDHGKKRVFDLVTASFLGFCVGGGNQMTALNVAIVLVTVIGFITFQKKWKIYKSLLFPIGLFYLGFVLNITAPGNRIRAEGAAGLSPVNAVITSLKYGISYCLDEWTEWPVMILMVALVPLFWHMAQKTEFSFKYPLVVVLFGYGLVSAMMTPPLFALGNMEAGRLQGLTFTMYILVLTLCVGYVTGWIRYKWRNLVSEESEEYFSFMEIRGLVFAMAFFVVGAMLTIIPEPHYFTFSSAVTDVMNGTAKAYGEAHMERIEQYTSGKKDIVVKPLSEKPALLFFSDISEDAGNWENKGVCRFYELDSVKTEN